MSLLLAAIADDFTGASDQAGMLARAGVASLLVLDEAFEVGPEWEAVTYATRLRSIPPAQARREARRLLEVIQALQPRMIQYKYCSTFDSTPDGNIGPILDETTSRLGVPGTIVMPALPVNGRTTYCGLHFVHGVPLDESPMRHHPLNPMTDANLARWLGQQTRQPIGNVTYETVTSGPEAVRAAIEKLWAQGTPYVILDCLDQRHVRIIAGAVAEMPFISGSSALTMELPGLWRRRGWLGPRHRQPAMLSRPAHVPVLALSGSCAAQTLRQVQAAEDAFEIIRIEPEDLLQRTPKQLAKAVLGQVERRFEAGQRVLVSSSQERCEREQLAGRLEGSRLQMRDIAARIERLLGEVARLAREELGIRHFICAGGETSGAIAQALGLQAVEIMREIAPGVPLCRALPDRDVAIAFKGGNFGADDFFASAAALASGVRLCE